MPNAPCGKVLLSWIAKRNDPFQTLRDETRIPGPTLGLLFDDASPYTGQFDDVVLFARDSDEEPRPGELSEQQILRVLTREIGERAPHTTVHEKLWRGEDPTDYEAIHSFLKDELPKLREQFSGREWVIHISPGTPTMQTIWVLMVETGQVQGPVTMVKSFRPWERKNGMLAETVRLDLDTLFKSLQVARPLEVADDADDVFWDPSRFQSEALKKLYRQARRFAKLNVPVLILGERGTGKTTLASWIRANSPFQQKELDEAWPSIACGSYTAETMRSELLGHEKGSFTGADTKKEGLLKVADGDTLFLDEIGDIAPDLQRLLIRALEEKRFYPIGAQQPVSSNFRLLAATNRPMAEVRDHLDADFLDRIGQFVLRLPPLRELPEDIPWLWRTVLREAVVRSEASDTFDNLASEHHEEIVRSLARHPLPGNIRDLFKVANRLIAARIVVDEDTPPLSAEAAVEDALSVLDEASRDAAGDLSREYASAFSRDQPLEGLLETQDLIEIKEHTLRFSAYLADEVLRFVDRRELDADEFTDYTRRRLGDLRKERR